MLDAAGRTRTRSTLLARMSALIHVDDPERADVYMLASPIRRPDYAELDEREQRFARMLFFTLWDDGGGFRLYDAGLDYLRSNQPSARESASW